MTRRYQRGSLTRQGPMWVLRFKEHQDGERIYRAIRVGPVSELRTRAAARAMADRVLAHSTGAALSGERIKFADYVPAWSRGHMVGIVRKSTQASWECILRVHLLPRFATWQLHDIDTRALQEFIGHLGTKELSTARIHNVTNLMRQLLSTARKEGYAAAITGPWVLRFPKDGRRHAERRCLTPLESRAIIRGSQFPHKALYALMAYTGCRCGEALGLTWRHVDFAHARIQVRQAAVAGRLYLPKTRGSIADLPLPEPLAVILREYAAWQDEQAGHIEERLDGLLFPGRHGGPLHSSGVRESHFKPLLARLGIAPAGLHAFRHGLATLLFENGATPGVVMQTLRHGSLRTTMTYTHTSQELATRALASTAALIAGAP